MKAVFGGGGGGGGSARQQRPAAGGPAAATGGDNGGAKGTNSGHPTYSIRERLKRARTPTKGGGSGGRCGDSLVDDDASEQPSEGAGAGKGGSPSKKKVVPAAASPNESTTPRSSWTSRLLRSGDSSSHHQQQQPKPERSPTKGIKPSASGKSQQHHHHPKLKLKSSRSIDSAETRDRVKQIVSQHFAGKHNGGGGGSVNANHPRGTAMTRYEIPDGTSDASSNASSSPQIVPATTLRDDDRDDGKEEEDDNNDNESPEGYDEFFRLLKMEVSGSHTQVRKSCRNECTSRSPFFSFTHVLPVFVSCGRASRLPLTLRWRQRLPRCWNLLLRRRRQCRPRRSRASSSTRRAPRFSKGCTPA
jgi:hypothetical protein